MDDKPQHIHRDFFDPPWDQTNVFLVDEATVRKAAITILSCEACDSEAAEIPFDNVLDAVKAATTTKKAVAKKAAKKPEAKTAELTPRQLLMAIPMDERKKGKFPATHALGIFAKLFGAKNAEGGTVQPPLDKPRTVPHTDLKKACPKDVAVDNMIKVLHDYGAMADKWHVTRDAEAKTVTLVPGKK
jgi:hypothetical protein